MILSSVTGCSLQCSYYVSPHQVLQPSLPEFLEFWIHTSKKWERILVGPKGMNPTLKERLIHTARFEFYSLFIKARDEVPRHDGKNLSGTQSRHRKDTNNRSHLRAWQLDSATWTVTGMLATEKGKSMRTPSIYTYRHVLKSKLTLSPCVNGFLGNLFKTH